jgi:hypothetical protein
VKSSRNPTKRSQNNGNVTGVAVQQSEEKPIQTRIDLKRVIYSALKIARVLVRFDHAAGFIGNAKLPSA